MAAASHPDQNMCGIVGIVAANGTVDPRVLQRMNDLVAHRGPDGEGFLLASGDWHRLRYSFQRRAGDDTIEDSPVRVGLGHRRLAILDLSDRGLQPMSTPDGRTWVVFNGEIYNHRELRSLLESEGHRFATRTDTEVLLKAYVEWGEDCVDRLDGMFAFAIWDDANARLFCARDRLGIKPFYYCDAGRALRIRVGDQGAPGVPAMPARGRRPCRRRLPRARKLRLRRAHAVPRRSRASGRTYPDGRRDRPHVDPPLLDS